MHEVEQRPGSASEALTHAEKYLAFPRNQSLLGVADPKAVCAAEVVLARLCASATASGLLYLHRWLSLSLGCLPLCRRDGRSKGWGTSSGANIGHFASFPRSQYPVQFRKHGGGHSSSSMPLR